MTFKALISVAQTHHTSHITHKPLNLQPTSPPPGAGTHSAADRQSMINTLYSKNTQEIFPIAELIQMEEAAEQQCQNSA